jgi:hypothetical protein
MLKSVSISIIIQTTHTWIWVTSYVMTIIPRNSSPQKSLSKINCVCVSFFVVSVFFHQHKLNNLLTITTYIQCLKNSSGSGTEKYRCVSISSTEPIIELKINCVIDDTTEF